MVYGQPLSKWFAFLAILLCANVCLGAPSDVPTNETLVQLQLIKDSINHTADPCDDFYAYACGNWEENHIYFSESAMYTILNFNYKHKVENIISSIVKYPENPSEHNQTFAEKLYTVRRSCNGGANGKYFDYVKPADNIEWPLINEHNERAEQNFDDFDIFALLGKLFSYGMNNVLINRTVKRLENGTLYITLDLPKSPKTDKRALRFLLVEIGYDFNSQHMNELADKIANTSARWYSKKYKYRYSTLNNEVLSYTELKETHPKLASFLENMLPDGIKSSDVIEVKNLEYFNFLLTKEWDASDVKDMCNYLMYSFFKFLSSDASLDCDKFVNRYMNLAFNYLYYEQNIKAHEEQYNEVFDTLLKQMYKYVMALVNENNLKFSDNMLEAIVEKLNRLHISKGNLPENVDAALVEEFYSDVPDLKINSFTENALHILKHHFRKTFDCPKYMECIDELGPVTVNIPSDDLMVIPFASFTPPMYHWNFDPLFSISLMGTLVGHEFAHSVDSTSLRSKKIFETLQEDFNNHPELNEAIECMNDQKTTDSIRERIADFAGARAAYQVYANEYNVQPMFSDIPWQKLFFLNMAQYFCQASYTQAISHDQSDVRMRQIAINTPAFAEAFQCPVGSKMNPEKKCRFY